MMLIFIIDKIEINVRLGWLWVAFELRLIPIILHKLELPQRLLFNKLGTEGDYPIALLR
jgi:hypothetical protein